MTVPGVEPGHEPGDHDARGAGGAEAGEPSRDAWVDRLWHGLSRWAVPVMMTLAYAFLAITSETNATGKAWMAVGLVLVMVVWFLFRALTEAAALSRALAVGDTARLLALASRLPETRRAGRRARLWVGRGLAQLLRGEPAEALAAVDEAHAGPAPLLAPELAALATVVRRAALIELGRPVAAADAVDAVRSADRSVRSADEPAVAAVALPRAPAVGWLGEAQLAWQRGEPELATQRLARVIDDIRAGSALRAIAHVYAARLADQRGDAQAAARHRAAAAGLAAPDARWLRSA